MPGLEPSSTAGPADPGVPTPGAARAGAGAGVAGPVRPPGTESPQGGPESAPAQAATTSDGPGFEGRVPLPGELPPASGAWREGDPPGHRLFADIGGVDLERGGRIDVRLAYETWGELNQARDNAVLVLHALTGDSHIRGPAGPGHPTAGWWTALIGPGAPIDTNRWFVVAPNILGGCQGSTGPASLAPDGKPYASRFPYITVRDTVAAELVLADHLGIDRWAMAIGGSLGGHRVLEWAAMAPQRVGAIIAVATGAQATADQIAWAHAQLQAIRADPGFRGGEYYDAPPGGGPHIGLSIARQIAHTTYRSAGELDARFGRDAQGREEPLGGGGRFAVQSYLDHQGAKLPPRFDANSYIVLTEAMMSHDIGRGRGGVEAALAGISARALIVAVDSDRLFLPELSQVIADHLPAADGVHLVHSAYGHDGFLIEFAQLAPLIEAFANG
ncbi:MAG: homoserine O-acetyltransferase [Bifidobacteriaceae bacterium]|nr:homoserine O-acetyltransferase [Bifidobacteriaceae bacterium]